LITKLDLTFVPDHVRDLLVKYIELEPIARVIGEGKIDEKEIDIRKSNKDSSASTFLYENSLSLEDFKNIIENIIEKNNLNQFIVVEDIENENTLAIVKEGDIEQFGMYVCSHCGMIFRTEEERIVHERIHYFI
jgi:hypothetical protein